MQVSRETSAYRQSLKTKIVEAAMVAFAEKGIKAVKMDDVAQMMGISKRTLYEIYADKEELLYQGVRMFDAMRRESMREYAEQAATVMDIIIEAYRRKVEEVHKVCLQFYIDLQKYPKVNKYLTDEHERNREQFLQFLRRGVSEGYFREDVNYELVARLFDAVGEYVKATRLMEQYSLAELFANLLLVPLRGFCTGKGLAVLDEAMP